MMGSKTPRVSAIVSTYGAERFIRGCLEDLVAQTIIDEMEILVIDSGSPQRESEVCREFMRQYPQIRLLRTERESLYVAWNRAIGMARGTYLSNANTDDRHRPDFFEVMTHQLDSNPEVALVYGDQYVTDIENETFAEAQARNATLRQWVDFSPDAIMVHHICGTQPVWRAELHQSMGMFDTSFQIAADYEMWMRFSTMHPLMRVAQPMGLYLESPFTISGSSNMFKTEMEALAVREKHLGHSQWAGRKELHAKVASHLYSLGYRFVRQGKGKTEAKPFIRKAIELDPWYLGYWKTYFVRCVVGLGSA